MYCPKCGLAQPAEINFCPKCGFQLTIVKELLTTNGLLVGSSGTNPINTARRGFLDQPGLKIMLWGWALLPITLGLGLISDAFEPILLPVSVFLVGLVWFLFNLLFRRTPLPISPKAPQLPSTMNTRPGLPVYQPPAGGGIERPGRHTGQLHPPPSVTEFTTQLLEKEKETNETRPASS